MDKDFANDIYDSLCGCGKDLGYKLKTAMWRKL